MNSDPFCQREFELLAAPQGHSLLRTAIHLTGERALAEDIVQETLLLAWRSFHQLDERTNCKAWLFRIMLNLLSKHRPRIRARPQQVSRNAEPAADTASTVAHYFLQSQILAALDSLSDEYRTVLLLGVVERFTCKEMAGILGVPIGTVISRLGRARSALRDALAGQGKGAGFDSSERQCVSRGIQ